jgi:hypothetical protein
VKLSQAASLIRSKNAGPFTLTFDIMFSTKPAYEHVKQSGILTAERFAHLYHVPITHVDAYECDQALAFKFSIPRPHPQGDFGDGDLHGGQQYAPLLEIEIPDQPPA